MKNYSKTFLFLLLLPLPVFAQLSAKIPIKSNCSGGGHECLVADSVSSFHTETRSGKISVPPGTYPTNAIFTGSAPISIGSLCVKYQVSGRWMGEINLTVHTGSGETSVFQQIGDQRDYTLCFKNTVYMQKDDFVTVGATNGEGIFDSIYFDNINFLY